MFRRLNDAMRRFMYGRYGSDQFNLAILITAVAVTLINSILSIFLSRFPVFSGVIYPLLRVAVLVLLGYYLFRSFSRNVYARQKENRSFRQFWSRLTDRKNRYYRCPKCRQMVRVPKGRGKISIRCPKCGERFIRKT